jgi:hypothetical protein
MRINLEQGEIRGRMLQALEQQRRPVRRMTLQHARALNSNAAGPERSRISRLTAPAKQAAEIGRTAEQLLRTDVCSAH